jgi:hypothetical protein
MFINEAAEAMPYTSTQNGVAIVGCAATGPLAFVINV